ncbi:MAG: molecular chaperone TorD family protein [Gammaproteobacteria bacterium]|nr:molecular chaperone TorD family protein [Gammaproteobacteria bacterium]MDH5800403.1 molecular chaperone TorD family protein [Gammaproteobacteria bacterium]
MTEEMIVESSSAAGSEQPSKTPGSEHLVRAGVYRLLAALLVSPPTPALLATVRALHANDVENASKNSATSSAMNAAWNNLVQAAEAHSAEQIEAEYFALFIGLGRGELLPYASWYLTGFLMEKPLARLRNRLQEMGLSRQQGVNEPEDHVAALCETMSVIITESRLSFKQEQEFVETFVLSWMRRFFDDLREAESSEFYQAVADVGRQFMLIEQQWFDYPP